MSRTAVFYSYEIVLFISMCIGLKIDRENKKEGQS